MNRSIDAGNLANYPNERNGY